MLDTLGIYRRLKQARASDAVSREIAYILGGIVESKLATKLDIMELRAEIANSRSETIRWMLAMFINNRLYCSARLSYSKQKTNLATFSSRFLKGAI